MQWLYQAKKRYGLIILNYTVTSNHIHLLVQDGKDRDVIPQSIKLVAGRTAQEYNMRKNRKGAFWEDRYHATAVESKEHLLKCLIYIDLNMVRTGKVTHPSEWPSGGYNEIQQRRRKSVLIDYQKLAELSGFTSYDAFQKAHLEMVNSSLENGSRHRQPEWTKSIAVGSKNYIESIKTQLGLRAKGRKILKHNSVYQLREDRGLYNIKFDAKMDDIDIENTYIWGNNDTLTTS